jgi:tetratricopeptide (TPR) repeat protein
MENPTNSEPQIILPLPGIKIGRYELISLLGSGGMGQVYLARDERLARDVAIKILPVGRADDPQRISRFLFEARTASALNHPNIVTIYDTGESELGIFLAMELVSGETLRSRIGRGLAMHEVVDLAIQLATGIAAAHAASIVHRDLKPENIMIRADGYLKILDFGLARLSDSEDETGTLARKAVGTLRYMSPEQGRGHVVGPPSDVFSLGLVTYEMLTGFHPFYSASPLATFLAIEKEPAPLPSQRGKGIPDWLDRIVLSMLEKRAERRPTAQQVAEELAECRSRGPGKASVIAAAVPAIHRTVGRESELAVLHAAFRGADAGHGALVCISGDAGLGKTTLAEEFLRSLASQNASCLIGRGRSSERLAGVDPYGPVREALANLLRSDPTNRLARSMKRTAPTWFDEVASAAEHNVSHTEPEARARSEHRFRLELIGLFESFTREQPLVLFFDDLQWADASTIDVIALAAGRFEESRLLIVATCRETEMRLANHPFVKLRLDLKAKGLCRELPLGYLSEEAVEKYLNFEFPGAALPHEMAARLHARTEGHPFFVSELVGCIKERRGIVKDGGAWSLSPDFAAIEQELPESIRSTIELKIAQIGEEEQRVLGAASVQGLEFDSAVVAKTLGMDPVVLEEMLERLDRVHELVHLSGEKEMPDRTLSCRYRFDHALFQNEFYNKLRPSRRAALSIAAAQALSGFWRGKQDEIASTLADLFETGRDFARAAQYHLTASGNAAAIFAWREAAASATRGLHAAAALPPGPEVAGLEMGLQMSLGRAVGLTEGYTAPEAVACFTRARELTLAAGDAPEVFPVIWGLYMSSVISADCPTASELAARLLRIAEPAADRTMKAAAHCAVAIAAEISGDYHAALEHSAQAISFDDPDMRRARAAQFGVDPGPCARGIHARTLWFTGSPDLCRQEAADLVARAGRDALDPRSICDHLVSACFCYQYLEDPAQIPELADRVIELCQKHDIALERYWAVFLRGWANAALGDTESGLADMLACWQFVNAIRALFVAGTAFAASLAEVMLRAGRFDEAREFLDHALQFASENGHRYCEPELHRLRGEVAAAAGNGSPESLAAAEGHLQDALECARRQKAPIFESRISQSLAKLRGAAGTHA